MARATNLMIGTVTLTVIAVGLVGFLGFRKIHAVQQRGPLRIVFEGSATGLAKGNSVNFDGVQVGEVLSIKLDGPRKIVALATVENSAPIRKDTVVGLEQQGGDRRDGDRAGRWLGCGACGAARRGRRSDAQRGSERGRDRSATPCTMSIICWSTTATPSRMRGLSFETYSATLAGKGDEIDRVLGKADTGFAGFDSIVGRLDNLLPDLDKGKDGELYKKVKTIRHPGRAGNGCRHAQNGCPRV